jgi:hypothetical protein
MKQKNILYPEDQFKKQGLENIYGQNKIKTNRICILTNNGKN